MPVIMLKNTTIPYSSLVKNLGIYMDANLNWNHQITHIIKKIFYTLHTLKRLKNFFPLSLKRILFQTLMMQHFDYCDALLTDLNDGLSKKLQRVHNMCIRFTCNVRHYNHFQLCPGFISKIDKPQYALAVLFQIIHNSTPPT